MSDIKKFLKIMDESTVAGCIASTPTALGGVQTRPKDSIFAFEADETTENSKPEQAPKVTGPKFEWANWSNGLEKVKTPKNKKQ